jgi:putative ABC transport system permease protein
MTAIAGVGVFAFVRSWVISLKRELALRRAVGARHRQIIGRVLARAMLIGLAGVAVGVWFGAPVWDGIGHLIPGVPGWRLEDIAVPALLLLGAAVAGAVLPAWRASHAAPARLVTDPSE